MDIYFLSLLSLCMQMGDETTAARLEVAMQPIISLLFCLNFRFIFNLVSPYVKLHCKNFLLEKTHHMYKLGEISHRKDILGMERIVMMLTSVSRIFIQITSATIQRNATILLDPMIVIAWRGTVLCLKQSI